VYFVQMMLRHGFGHELLYAFVKGAISNTIYGRAPSDALTRSPLSDGHFRRTAGTSNLILVSPRAEFCRKEVTGRGLCSVLYYNSFRERGLSG
jgi:hypothetical protein